MNTKDWGPVLNRGLFYVAAGYDFNETPKSIKDPQYKEFFRLLGKVLPCRYCRESYDKFYQSLDNNSSGSGRRTAYYDIRNLVNAKLLTQEREALEEVDENYHRYYNIPCELKRIEIIHDVARLPLVLIRFNPHSQQYIILEEVLNFVRMAENFERISAENPFGVFIFFIGYPMAQIERMEAEMEEQTTQFFPYVSLGEIKG
ncbi:hypothetical protein HDV00_003176 [Rhizophlyctis rosea]|nr:hypothetical protein HDV00_003176 [Rhizophlyctis rosea]